MSFSVLTPAQQMPAPETVRDPQKFLIHPHWPY